MPFTLDLTGLAGSTFIFEDDGIVGNGVSRVRLENGTTIDFTHPADLLTIVSKAGQTLVLDMVDSLGAANLVVGSLTDPTKNPDAILIDGLRGTSGTFTLAATGAISESGADAGADVVAGALALSAGTGIGTPANAIEIQVGTLEAETNTGGIALANLRAVNIGGITSDIAGLHVLNSGDIFLSSLGTIQLADAGGSATVRSVSGDVTILASGASADFVSLVNHPAFEISAGSLTLTVGRDVRIGTLITNANNDVLVSGDIIIGAGRDVFFDGLTDVLSTAGRIEIVAGANVGVLDSRGNASRIASLGLGDVEVRTGPGGTLTLNAGGNALSSAGGDVIVDADRILIAADSGMSATSGLVWLRPATVGREVVVGSATDAAFALELSDAELDRISTPVLAVGDLDSGLVTVQGAINPLNVPGLGIFSGSGLIVTGQVTTTSNVVLRATGDLYLTAGSSVTTSSFIADLDIGNLATDSRTLDIDGNVSATASSILDGGGGADTINGSSQSDSINGRGGADRMSGGLGNDFYRVDDPLDFVFEQVGEGDDSITTSVSFSLALGSEVETLRTDNDLGTSPINLTGNEFSQTIFGNAGDNVLRGGFGSDTLVGRGGNDTYAEVFGGHIIVELAGGGVDTAVLVDGGVLADNVENLILGELALDGTGNALDNILTGNDNDNRLDGGGGADTMTGGLGDDVYVVDNAGDAVEEAASEGIDWVESSVTFTLPAEVERLTLTGSAAVNGTGNALDNRITGNTAANVLKGNPGDDLLIGGGGADKLFGGPGDDSYDVDHVGDVVSESSPADGIDEVFSTVSYSLGAHVENLILTGAAATNATGNSLANVLVGNGAANILNGGGGADIMQGETGNDIYIVDNAADFMFENTAGGTDLVKSNVSFTLTANVEKLTLRGAAAIDGTGNDLANTIAGNSAANVLDGGTGADKLLGGDGNDTYVVDNVGDQVTEASSGGGTDLVRSSVSFTIGANVERLTLTGSDAINGTGNDLANLLTGNGVANVLDGGRGNDTLDGASGADTLKGGLGNDILTGGNGGDEFRFDKPLGATNVDHVVDFASAQADKIVLENAVFVGLASGALNPNALRIGAAAVDADDRIVYDPATGRLYYDSDGSGATAQVLFAILDNAPATLSAGDFSVI